MPQTAAELLDAALALPDAERSALAEVLAASVRPAAGLHPDWSAELRRRVAEVESGQVRPVPWAEVRDEVRAMLAGETCEGPTWQPSGWS